MSDKIAPHGPFRLEMHVYATDGKGTDAQAHYDFPPGHLPTSDDLKDALQKVQAAPLIVEHDLRLMGRHEFVAALLEEQTGQGGFAVPGPDEWDALP